MTELAIAPGTADILGQQSVCDRLWSALGTERLHHCYLFEGPPGVGKATVALRLAMAANCESTGSVRPCATCPTCRRIAEDKHPDVIRLGPDPEKATDVITVDQAREIIRVLSLHRHSARRRFVIVDPVDLLRVEATNALLKTFEEPPAETGFILVTARSGMLLPTVLSRSLRVRFHTVATPDLERWLVARGIAHAPRVARLAFGSPGGGLRLSEGRLEALDEAREALLTTLTGGTMGVLGFAEKLGAAARPTWEKRVGALLDVMEMLLRDAAHVGAGREAPRPGGMGEDDLLLPEVADVSRRWARALWPSGIDRVRVALADARTRLFLNVSVRVVIENLLIRLGTELGPEGCRGSE